jgi:hypothetical protein
MLNKDELTLNNTERKLLWGIYETLQEIKSLLVPATREQTGADFDSLKRNELMALVKNLPERPDSWSKLGNKDLIKLLKEGV